MSDIERDPAASLGSQRDAMLALAKLARREHLACEDRWYSCPLAEGGCANDVWGKDECSCGASRINAEVDAIVAAFPASPTLTDEEREAIAKAAQWMDIPCASNGTEPMWFGLSRNDAKTLRALLERTK